MKSFKKVTVVKDEVCELYCNMCENQIDTHNLFYTDNFISIEKKWEYGSEFDGEVHKIDMCLDCYRRFIKLLKINPKDTF